MKAVCETAEPQAGKDSFLLRPVAFMQCAIHIPMYCIFSIVLPSILIGVLFRNILSENFLISSIVIFSSIAKSVITAMPPCLQASVALLFLRCGDFTST